MTRSVELENSTSPITEKLEPRDQAKPTDEVAVGAISQTDMDNRTGEQGFGTVAPVVAETPTSIPVSERSILALIQYVAVQETGGPLGVSSEGKLFELSEEQEECVKLLAQKLYEYREQPGITADTKAWQTLIQEPSFEKFTKEQQTLLGQGCTFAAFAPAVIGGLDGTASEAASAVEEASKRDYDDRVKPNLARIEKLEEAKGTHIL